MKCQHMDVPRRLLGNMASLMEPVTPRPRKQKAKNQASEDDGGDGGADSHDEAVSPNTTGTGRGRGKRKRVASGKLEDHVDEADTLSLADLTEKYRSMKARF